MTFAGARDYEGQSQAWNNAWFSGTHYAWFANLLLKAFSQATQLGTVPMKKEVEFYFKAYV